MVHIHVFGYVQLAVALSIHVTAAKAQVDTIVATGKVASAAKALITLFSTEEEHRKDLTAAEEMIRGLTFDIFEENVSCAVKKGIKIEDYSFIVNRFAKRFGIPENITDSLLDGQYIRENDEMVYNFKFRKGEKGNFVYGRVATVKHGGEIDMAYSVYSLDFKLSPKVIEHEQEKVFLGFIRYGKKVWRETEERNLSIEDKKHLQAYFTYQAIIGFKKVYLPLIESEKAEYCSEKECRNV